MIQLTHHGVYIKNGRDIIDPQAPEQAQELQSMPDPAEACRQTMTHAILTAHNTSGSPDHLRLKFDALTSHDITYVGIIQTARASGLREFPLPYVLTNCHNSLCAVGGTINEDDHIFGLSAARKYGGIYVPAHQAVIHQYMRETMAGCGKMILGSDSHTRYGALGTLAMGEGGPELVKQLMGRTYDIPYPGVIAVSLSGQPRPGVGPQDVALAIIKAVFSSGFVKNKVMEFIGDGIRHLNMDYRMGIDVMTTETTCLSSIWQTDTQVSDYLQQHGRASAYAELNPGPIAYYDGLIRVDLSAVKPMIALPFHPSNAYAIEDLQANLADILRETEKNAAQQTGNPNLTLPLTDKIIDGTLHVDQGVIAGCAGGSYDNIAEAAHTLQGSSIGSDAFSLSVYPASQPVLMRLSETGALTTLMAAGATIRTAFCGPCFGAGDVPAHHGLSIRHSTRNFPNREGSQPGNGQLSAVALMDARSIAATAKNGGRLTAADTAAPDKPLYIFNNTAYASRVYQGFNQGQPDHPLAFGPNIADWPEIPALNTHLLLKTASVITDAVTTTDELIPSGETSSYRSNPEKLAAFTLSRKDPNYVPLAKTVRTLAGAWQNTAQNSEEHNSADDILASLKTETGGISPDLLAEFSAVLSLIKELPTAPSSAAPSITPDTLGLGTLIFAAKPGDGSAREQAASCQRVLGTQANIAYEYATKRYRSNLINWGMLPLLLRQTSVTPPLTIGDYLFIPNIRTAIEKKHTDISAYIINSDGKCPPQTLTLALGELTDEERSIILAGCLINHYRS